MLLSEAPCGRSSGICRSRLWPSSSRRMAGSNFCAGTCGGANCRAGCRRSVPRSAGTTAARGGRSCSWRFPYVRARRREHPQYCDLLVRRCFAGLACVPTARTVSNCRRRFTQETPRPLVQLNQELVLETLARLDVPRLTLDVDGTIVRTGATVAWAFRGLCRIERMARVCVSLRRWHGEQENHRLFPGRCQS